MSTCLRAEAPVWSPNNSLHNKAVQCPRPKRGKSLAPMKDSRPSMGPSGA